MFKLEIVRNTMKIAENTQNIKDCPFIVGPKTVLFVSQLMPQYKEKRGTQARVHGMKTAS